MLMSPEDRDAAIRRLQLQQEELGGGVDAAIERRIRDLENLVLSQAVNTDRQGILNQLRNTDFGHSWETWFP